MCELMKNKNIYLGFIFDHIIRKKSSPQNLKILQFFWFFTNFQNFQLKLRDLYFPKGTILMADFFTTNTTFQALQDRIPFGRFGDTYVFFGRNSMEQTHRNNHIFCYKPGRCGPIVLIFELDRDIDETVLCTKFHHNRISL